MFKKVLFLLTIVACLGWVVTDISYAQTTPESIDFRAIKVDEMTDAQVRQFKQRAETSGMTMQELEAQAIARGMPVSEVQKLRARIESLRVSPTEDSTRPVGERTVIQQGTLDEIPQRTATDTARPEAIFGSNLFRRENLTFEPSLNIPTPKGYILGPGDELTVEVWGASQQTYTLPVSPEGQVRISNLGPVQVSGLTIEDASELIIRRLSSIYSGLRGTQPNTFAQVTLGNIRSIKVTIAGDAFRAGTYTLPAFASAFNALYFAGGPADNGSFRDIRIIRDNQVIARLDLYDFLVNGETLHNIRLRDEDMIFIAPFQNRIFFEGEVVRPAIYELTENETLEDLIRFAGGFSPVAYSARLQVDRKTDNQRKLLNVEKELFSSFLMRTGDRINVGRILDRYENRVTVQGAVYREGIFALSESLTLLGLIAKAEGLREDAFLNRAVLYRLTGNRNLQTLDLNLEAIIAGDAPDIVLQREDLLMISSVLELQQERTVRIYGEVQQPGTFPWAQNISLGEVIRKANGFLDAASLARVEVARRINDPEALRAGQTLTQVFNFPVDASLSLNNEAAAFQLQPFDMIFVRRSPGYHSQQLVQVRGEVTFPGSYAITSKTEYVSDLINRAGGLTPEAYLKGATLIRINQDSREARRQRLMTLETLDDQEREALITQQEQFIGIDLEKIISQPYSRHDVLLMPGDIIQIPLELQTVQMSGAVLFPTSALYNPGRGVRAYVSRAGGFADNAHRAKVHVLHPNGTVDRTRNYVLFKNYPSIQPGSEIIVPEKPERERRSLQETIAISSAITSLALVIVTLVNQL